jgi:hypothetical protein
MLVRYGLIAIERAVVKRDMESPRRRKLFKLNLDALHAAAPLAAS